MENVPIESLGETFTDLARRVEQGEAVVLTRDGKPVIELVPHTTPPEAKPKGGIDWEGGRRFLAERGLNREGLEEFKRARGIDKIVTYIAPDFDDPLPEDFLLQPLPDPVQAPGWK